MAKISLSFTVTLVILIVVVLAYVLALATITDVSVSPNIGTSVIGDTLTATLTTDEPLLGRLTAEACTINNVDVSNSFLNNDDGTYTFTYTVLEGDADQKAGAIPISCTLKDLEGGTTTASSWTDENTAAIDANKPSIISLAASPNPAKAEALVIEILFNEPMDMRILPIVAFGTFSENTILSRGDGTWSSDKTIWKETFDIVDQNQETPATITVSDAKDIAGNMMEDHNSAGSFTIDTLAPALVSISISSTNEGSENVVYDGDEAIIAFESSEKINLPDVMIGGVSPDSILNTAGNAWVATRQITEGELGDNSLVPFSIDFSDVAGNKGEKTTTTTDGSYLIYKSKDAVPPQLHILGPDDGTVSSGSAGFLFKATDEGGLDDASLLINGVIALAKSDLSNNADTEESFSLALEDGTYVWSIRAFDLSGNIHESANRTLLVDSSGPTTSAYAFKQSGLPYKFNTSTSGKVSVNFTCYSSTSSCDQTKYCIDAGNVCTPDTAYDQNSPLEIAKEGISYLRFSSVDNWGVMETIKFKTVRINKTDPELSISFPEDGSYFSTRLVSVEGTAFDLNPDQISISHPSFSSNLGNYTDWKFASSGLPDGTYSLSVMASDRFGQSAEESVSFTVDTTPPKNILFVSPTPTPNSIQSSRYYTINLTFDESNPSICLLNDGSTNSTMTISGKTCTINLFSQYGGTKHYTVWVKDRAGNTAVSDSRSFIIDAAPPILAISSPLNNTINPKNLITFEFNSSDSNMKNVSLYLNGLITMTNSSGLSGKYQLSKNLPDGKYVWHIQSYDIAGNLKQSKTRSFIIDTQKPSVELAASAEMGSNRSNITINLAAIDKNLEKVAVELFNSSSLVETKLFANSLIRLNFANLADDLYTINVTAFDLAGNSDSATINLSIDTVRPIVKLISPFNETVQNENVATFNLTVSDKNLANVTLYIDGMINVINNSGLSGSYTFRKMLSYGAHNWSIIAFDKAGNNKTKTRSLTVQTVSEVEVIPAGGSPGGSGGSGGGFSSGGPLPTSSSDESELPETAEGQAVQQDLDNKRLDQALESFLTVEELTEEARGNLLEVSSVVSENTEIERTYAEGPGKTTVSTNVSWNGNQIVSNLIVHVTVPKSFGQHADDITIEAPGSRIIIVNPDPEYLIAFDQVIPGQQLNINYTVNKSLASVDQIVQKFSSVIYAESISEPQVCKPSELQCAGSKLKKCSLDGLSWSIKKSCEFGCSNASCKPEPQKVPHKIYLVLGVVVILGASFMLYRRLASRKRRK